jgi:hypothetical protein
MIKVSVQTKSGQRVTRTVITLLASAIDLVEGLTSHHDAHASTDPSQRDKTD